MLCTQPHQTDLQREVSQEGSSSFQQPEKLFKHIFQGLRSVPKNNEHGENMDVTTLA